MQRIAIFALIVLSHVIVEPCRAESCAALSPHDCWHSTRCSLDCQHKMLDGKQTCAGEYLCRPKKGVCELHVAQAQLTKQVCLDHRGCIWEEYPCFCAAALDTKGTCACSGGIPPVCSPIFH